MAYCADCGEVIAYALMYMSRDAAKSIQYMDLGSKQNPMEYYFLCPFCNNLEQGAPLGEHKCKEISWNQYRVIYKPIQEQMTIVAIWIPATICTIMPQRMKGDGNSGNSFNC